MASSECLPPEGSLDGLESMGEVISAKNGHLVKKLSWCGRPAYAKWFQPSHGFVPWLKRKFRKPLATRLFHIHQEMLEAGIGCPEPFLAATAADGTALFICAELPFPSIVRIFKDADSNSFEALFRTAAASVAALHRAGFIHGDCLPGNICLSPDGQSFFIDNDRTRKGQSKRRREVNIIQFCSHTATIDGIDESHYRAFIMEHHRLLYGSDALVPYVERLLERIRRRIAVIAAQRQAMN